MRPDLTLRIATMSAPRRSDFRFLDRLRVRWAEVDLQKIVFNGHYLMYFDTAVAGYWRALALPYQETMAGLQGDLYVRKASLEYLASARCDDLLAVGIRCSRIGNSSLVMTAAVFRGDQCLVHGEMVYVFADPQSQTSKPVPSILRDWFQGFEAGQAAIELRTGDWALLGASVGALRQAVLVDGQGASAGTVADAGDAAALHAVLFNRAGLPLATGRLSAATGDGGQIGRMATLASLRGCGLGRRVLDALVEAARQRGDRELRVHSAPAAVAFCERAGFRQTGDVHIESGIEHPVMRLVF